MINILVTLDSHYIPPLKVMLKSLFLNNGGEEFTIYLMHSSIPEDALAELTAYVEGMNHKLIVVPIDDGLFTDAPILLHYTKEMYYRLLAFRLLPRELDRILYLDPDILVINPVQELYDLDIREYLYAAAYHETVKEINRIRFNSYEIDAYYNSGVLLMNLELQRKLIDERDIYDFVEKNKAKLIMPDQDIMNALYAKKIRSLDERIYNYDARRYYYYKLSSGGTCDMDFIIRNTVFLHFCGKKKPWTKTYSGKFHSLYKHYEKLALG